MPDNLLKIKTPGLNKDIWDNVSKQHRANDKNNLKLQQLLQAAAINTARNADVFVKSLRHNREGEVLKQALITSLDTMSMLGTLSDSISRTRRSRLKNGLNANINSICEIRYDEDTLQGRASDYLFGNDLNDTIARGNVIGRLPLKSARMCILTQNRPDNRAILEARIFVVAVVSDAPRTNAINNGAGRLIGPTTGDSCFVGSMQY